MFLRFCSENFSLDDELSLQLYKIFRTRTDSGCKIVNVLEVFVAVVILAQFGSYEEKSCNLTNGLMIEHKINLLILLFSFRESLNISEVVIMAKTCLSALSKI